MRLTWGRPPHAAAGPPAGDGWRPIRSPGSRPALFLAGCVGLLILGLLCVELELVMALFFHSGSLSAGAAGRGAWLAQLLPLLLFTPAHELLHAAFYPDHGLSSQTMLIVWPARLLLAVYHDGCLTRRQWLTMRLAPLVGLSLLPAGLVILARVLPIPWGLNMAMQVLMVANALGSGADVVAVVAVLRQVPPGGVIAFHDGRAYWRAGAGPAAQRPRPLTPPPLNSS